MVSGARRVVTGQELLETGKRLFSFLLALYLIFLVGRAVYLNFRVKQRILEIETEVKSLKADNQRLANLISYYQTETFRELEARSKLGLKKPGETVIAVPENADEPLEERRPGAQPADQASQVIPNYVKWWEYLFGES